MASRKPDCKQIPILLSAINRTRAELEKLRGEMDALGFDSARQVNLVKKLYDFINVVSSLSPAVLTATISFVGCNDAVLSNLTLEELKALTNALVAHADLVLAALPSVNDRTDEQKALAAGFTTWRADLGFIVAGFPMVTKDQLVMQLSAAKKATNTGSPQVLKALQEVFTKQLADQIAAIILSKKGIKDFTDNKTLISTLAEKVVISVLGKVVAKKVIPYIDIALTGWELLVELAGGAQAKELITYINQLQVNLVTLMKDCGYSWPQNAGKDPDGNIFYGFYVPERSKKTGVIYKGATVVARPFIRCAKLVDGNYIFGDPCPVQFTTGATVETTLKEENFANGAWSIPATIDKTSVQNAPCFTNGYCFAYLQLTFTLKDGSTVVINMICGVQTPP